MRIIGKCSICNGEVKQESIEGAVCRPECCQCGAKEKIVPPKTVIEMEPVRSQELLLG